MMKALRRWKTSIQSSFEWMVNQIENHEALVTEALSQAQDAGARARVRLERVRTDGSNIRKRLAELREEQTRWEERAKKVSSLDQHKALECLRRRRKTELRIADLEVQEREHAKAEKQLTADLALINERLAELRQKRNLMRTRESRAEAFKALQTEETGALSEIDEIFERWETRISECEVRGGCLRAENDELDAEFLGSEQEEDLRRELSELLKGGGASGGCPPSPSEPNS